VWALERTESNGKTTFLKSPEYYVFTPNIINAHRFKTELDAIGITRLRNKHLRKQFPNCKFKAVNITLFLWSEMFLLNLEENLKRIRRWRKKSLKQPIK
jgi:hypothetical protein